jgi:hypothetical protein
MDFQLYSFYFDSAPCSLVSHAGFAVNGTNALDIYCWGVLDVVLEYR